MPETFVKKPVEAEAVLWEGGDEGVSVDELVEWGVSFHPDPTSGATIQDGALRIYNGLHDTFLQVRPGEWIIKGKAEGDFYPCDPDEFERTYESVAESRERAAHELAEARSEIRRHHEAFEQISALCEAGLTQFDPTESIKRIRSIVG